MSSFRSILFKDIGVKRLWNAWTRGYRFSYMVRRCRRERTVREVFQYFRQTFFKPRRTLLMSVTAAYNSRSEETTDCNVGISDDELEGLLSDVESVKELIKVTVQCKSCSKRVVIDKKQTGVQYCDCEDGHPAEDSSDGWVPFMEAEDVIIWRKEYKTGQGLYAYKVYGRYPEVSARDFAAVQLDGAYRRAWDAAVAALAVVQRHALGVPGQAVLHWEVLWPRLFANRDYVYIRRHKEFDSFVETQVEKRQLMGERERVDNKVYVIVSKSCEHPDVPETRHAIRVMEYWSHMVVKTIEGVEKNGMEFVLTYYDEPARGGMPAGVAAWATGRAAPGYLARMRSAALHYRAWAAATPHQRQEMPDFTPFDPELVDEQQKNASSQISEQDMESSKEGPEMENNENTRDQSTQTEEINNGYEIKEIVKEKCIDVTSKEKNKEDTEKSNDAKETLGKKDTTKKTVVSANEGI
ncbi:PREDICTED: stAR-related lipid transfer protein 7, mitochondrial-like isoform X2 [Papilio polytes]|uniref:stAR-related lipid transfer protein 7, mitochondrial-like isoform X2 n=1 Tax=Papilio polytes TaxID=76194 RepID=UPI0006765E94|nr:PREDICTED: stAR-related lipid transfer protein 7, mitochondrial-like isoform X2 [Papilio polytes]